MNTTPVITKSARKYTYKPVIDTDGIVENGVVDCFVNGYHVGQIEFYAADNRSWGSAPRKVWSAAGYEFDTRKDAADALVRYTAARIVRKAVSA
jgi:hypothetical protein